MFMCMWLTNSDLGKIHVKSRHTLLSISTISCRSNTPKFICTCKTLINSVSEAVYSYIFPRCEFFSHMDVYTYTCTVVHTCLPAHFGYQHQSVQLFRSDFSQHCKFALNAKNWILLGHYNKIYTSINMNVVACVLVNGRVDSGSFLLRLAVVNNQTNFKFSSFRVFKQTQKHLSRNI